MPAYETQIRLRVAYGTPRWEVEKALSEAITQAQEKLGGVGQSTFTELVESGPTTDEAVTALIGAFASATQSYRERKRSKSSD